MDSIAQAISEESDESARQRRPVWFFTARIPYVLNRTIVPIKI